MAPARRLYRAFGIDLTSTRPSSEALWRRILQGKPFSSINSAVEVCNLCSTSFLLPIGLYDAAKISGDVTLRQGELGESYPGIRKDSVNVAGPPVLVDDLGPFGNPTSDWLRSCVTEDTASLFMVIRPCGDRPAPDDVVRRVLTWRSLGAPWLFGDRKRGHSPFLLHAVSEELEKRGVSPFPVR